uniref:Uncharacterized protein n=1 Tax=Ixodes scapularis TaxID=6945 RepID=A0A4D5RCZ3_IXOSC
MGFVTSPHLRLAVLLPSIVFLRCFLLRTKWRVARCSSSFSWCALSVWKGCCEVCALYRGGEDTVHMRDRNEQRSYVWTITFSTFQWCHVISVKVKFLLLDFSTELFTVVLSGSLDQYFYSVFLVFEDLFCC